MSCPVHSALGRCVEGGAFSRLPPELETGYLGKDRPSDPAKRLQPCAVSSAERRARERHCPSIWKAPTQLTFYGSLGLSRRVESLASVCLHVRLLHWSVGREENLRSPLKIFEDAIETVATLVRTPVGHSTFAWHSAGWYIAATLRRNRAWLRHLQPQQCSGQFCFAEHAFTGRIRSFSVVRLCSAQSFFKPLPKVNCRGSNKTG